MFSLVLLAYAISSYGPPRTRLESNMFLGAAIVDVIWSTIMLIFLTRD